MKTIVLVFTADLPATLKPVCFLFRCPCWSQTQWRTYAQSASIRCWAQTWRSTLTSSHGSRQASCLNGILHQRDCKSFPWLSLPSTCFLAVPPGRNTQNFLLTCSNSMHWQFQQALSSPPCTGYCIFWFYMVCVPPRAVCKMCSGCYWGKSLLHEDHCSVTSTVQRLIWACVIVSGVLCFQQQHKSSSTHGALQQYAVYTMSLIACSVTQQHHGILMQVLVCNT